MGLTPPVARRKPSLEQHASRKDAMTSTTATGSAAAVRKAASIGTAPPPAFALRPLPGGCGAEVVGLAVRDVDDASFPAIHEAFLAHQILLFRASEVPPADQVAFARRFGEV